MAAAEEKKRILNGVEIDDQPYLLKNYLQDWLKEYKAGVVRKNTYELHRQNIEKHIIPYFKNADIKDIKPIMYQKFINNLCNQGYSKRTAEIIHGTMYNAMEKAIVLGKIEKNPCAGAEIKANKKRKSDDLEYMRSEDISIFLRAAYQYGYIYYVFFKTLINTGMRKGEAAALQWSDIDLRGKTININKTLDFQLKIRRTSLEIPKHSHLKEQSPSANNWPTIYMNSRNVKTTTS